LYLACAIITSLPIAAHADDVAVEDIIARIGLSAQIGDGWNVEYDNHTASSRAVSGGVGADLVVGNPNIGLLTSVGLLYDGGTTPDAATPRDPLWLLDLGLGLEASPYALIKRQRFELRLHLAARGAAIIRPTCDDGRCMTTGEPSFGMMLAGHAGVIAWWGDKRARGLGVDLVVMRGQLGNFTNYQAPSSAVFDPPVFFVRATYEVYRGKYVDKGYKAGTQPLEMPKRR
jgi:hypothetical protein